MKLKELELPSWIIKLKGDDKGIYRITHGNSKDGVYADKYISVFTLHTRGGGVYTVNKHFSYNTFQQFRSIDKLNPEMKKNFLVCILDKT